MSFFKKLRDRMFRSSDKIRKVWMRWSAKRPPVRVRLRRHCSGRLLGRDETRRVVDDAMLESLEDVLIQADMGVDTALRVTANIAAGWRGKRVSTDELKGALAGEVARIMEGVARPMPFVPQQAAGRAGGGGQRIGQDHDDWQAGRRSSRRRAKPL